MSSRLVRLCAVAALAIGSIALAGPVAAECSGYSHKTTASTSAPAPATTASTSTQAGGG